MAGNSDQTLNYKLIFGADASDLEGVVLPSLEDINGQLDLIATSGEDAAAGFEDMGAAAEQAGAQTQEVGKDLDETGKKGSSSFGSMGSMMERMLIRLTLMQLGLSAVMNLMKNDEGLQTLQQEVMGLADGVLDVLDPAFQGLAATIAIIKNFDIADYYTGNWSRMLGAASSAATAMTVQQAAALKIQEDAQAAHNVALEKLQLQQDQTGLQLAGADDAAKLALVQKEADAEINLANTNFAIQQAELAQKLGTRKMTQAAFDASLVALIQKTQDNVTLATQQAADKRLIIERQELLQRVTVQSEAEKSDEAHNAAMMKVTDDFFKQEIAKASTSYAQKFALVNAQEQADLAAAQRNYDSRKAVLDQELAAKMLSQTQYQQKAAALTQSFQDQEVQIERAAAQERKAIANELAQSVLNVEEAGANAVVSTLKTEIQARASAVDTLKAIAADSLQAMADAAAKEIETAGAVAAAENFKSAAQEAGWGWAGIAAGAIAAAETLAEYTVFAGMVEGAGTAASMGMGGGTGAGAAKAGTTASTTASTTAAAAPASTATTAPVAASTSPSGASVATGGGPSSGTLNLTVNLDGQAILRLVSQASFNGNIVISGNAIQGG